MTIRSYCLGCPSWGFKGWAGRLYRRRSRQSEWLEQYARVFNCVEGNTTFYSTPSPETVARWREQTPASFRFCFKFPQTITHQKRLGNVSQDTVDFLGRMAPLGSRLGPFMIQFPAALGPEDLTILDRYLGTLPDDFHYAVELRHPGLFESAAAVARLDAMLRARGCDRVVLDSRPLRSGDPGHRDVRAARTQKPNLPVHLPPTPRSPFARFISHPQDEVDEPWFSRWAKIVAEWIREGRSPFFMVHCPNDVHSPRFARRFHELLRQELAGGEVDVGQMPPWPGEEPVDEGGQLRLF